MENFKQINNTIFYGMKTENPLFQSLDTERVAEEIYEIHKKLDERNFGTKARQLSKEIPHLRKNAIGYVCRNSDRFRLVSESSRRYIRAT
ncbi:hypothetical protein AKJ36_02910 [candidate division MSBL1 archaeon SCGC-AAA259I07]|uniref:Uncharacterized protein n=2 Tax=candidate division MSBL1 TaxID=215777 RepID=A0A133UJN7_9EURY|nr:hypothetical protein AKJ36_02910 [candidate division MSBL1 archaeon SCGC-AAA259I07]